MPRKRSTSKGKGAKAAKAPAKTRGKPPTPKKRARKETRRPMPYYMLECFEPDDWEDSAILQRAPKLPGVDSWRLGARFPGPLPEPIEFLLLPTHSDDMLEMDNTDALLMTRRLHDALRGAGVDNLDAYQAVIRHPGTGKVIKDYLAVNVIGLISAADLGKSTVVGGMSGGLLDVDFEGVAVSEERARGALMFRLAENTSAVLIHERVRDHLLEQGFDMLTFVPPEEWVG